jgi:CBS domain containing-hemolysin-like protein
MGRLPRKGDAVRVGPYDATVIEVTRRRVARLRFLPVVAEESAEEPV